MKKILIAFVCSFVSVPFVTDASIVFAKLSLQDFKSSEAAPPVVIPAVPNASLSIDTVEAPVQKVQETQTKPTLQTKQEVPKKNSPPVRLTIPSIGLDIAVESVGINSKGEMVVPDGKSKTVGWYKYGTAPGDIGSAVMTAHVYAAFSKLKKIPSGSDVYVVTEDGKKLHFIVSEKQVYRRENVPLQTLFNSNDARRLNFITCSGTWDWKAKTYDHRLVVYTTLVGD